MSNSLYCKYRKLFNFIIVAGVVAIRPLVSILARMNDPFQNELRILWHLQFISNALADFGFLASQKAGESVFT